MSRTWLCTIVVGILIVISLLVGAHPAAAQDPKQEARVHFERGVKLSDEQSWDAALAEFLQSRELFPTRGAEKNAAVCLRKLRRYEEALEMIEGVLKEFPNMPQEDRWSIENEIKELQGLVGFLTVKPSEAGATVVI